MNEIIGERGELVENDVLRIALKLRAFVVNFLDVALGAGGSHDVFGMRNPLLQPLEALAAHARRQNGNAAASKDARNRNAAAAVISRRRPDRLLARRIEISS